MSPADLDTDRAQVAALGSCVEGVQRLLAGTSSARSYEQGYADALAWALGQVEGARAHARRREVTHHDEAARIVARLRAMTCEDIAELLRRARG